MCALAGPGDLHHREAVRRRVRQRDQAVEEARAPDTVRHTPGLLREEPGGRGRVAGVAFVAEADVADARRLREARQVGDRDADHPVDGLYVVELERVDDQVAAIGQCLGDGLSVPTSVGVCASVMVRSLLSFGWMMFLQWTFRGSGCGVQDLSLR